MKLIVAIVLSVFVVLSKAGVLKREDIAYSDSNVLSEPHVRDKRTLGIDKKFDKEVEIKSKLGSIKVKNSFSYNDGGAITYLPNVLDSIAINHNRMLAGHRGIGLTNQIGEQTNADISANAQADISANAQAPLVRMSAPETYGPENSLDSHADIVSQTAPVDKFTAVSQTSAANNADINVPVFVENNAGSDAQAFAVNQGDVATSSSAGDQADSTSQVAGVSQASAASDATANAPPVLDSAVDSAAHTPAEVNESSGSSEAVVNVPMYESSSAQASGFSEADKINEASGASQDSMNIPVVYDNPVDSTAQNSGVSQASGSSETVVPNMYEVPTNTDMQSTGMNEASGANNAFINVPVVFESEIGPGFQPVGVSHVAGGPNVRFLGVGRLSGFGQVRFGDQPSMDVHLVETDQIARNSAFHVDGQANAISLASAVAPYETQSQVHVGENQPLIYNVENEGGIMNKKKHLIGSKFQAIKGIGQSAVTGVKKLVDKKIHFIGAVGQGVVNGAGKVIEAEKRLIKNKIQFVGDVGKGIATGAKNVVTAKRLYAVKKASDGITFLSSLKKVGPPCCPDGPCCPDRAIKA